MADKLEVEIIAKDHASGVFGSIRSHLGGILETAAGFGVATLAANAIGGLTSQLGEMVSGAMEAEEIQAQLNNVIKSTGGVAGITAEAANSLAESLSGVTKFEDDAIVAGENLLLTFTNIGKDVFPTATETMLDMSEALGQDMKSSAIQLGKALNDPVAGITALSRVGVSFTEQQKEQIKALVAAGDTMGAQKLILAELNREFGGAAKAAGDTFAGKLAILQNKLGNVKETIGAALLPVMTKLLDAAMPLITAFGNWLPGALDAAGKVAGDMVGKVRGVADGIADILSNMLGWGDAGEWSSSTLESFTTMFEEITARAGDFIAVISDLPRRAIGGISAFLRGDMETALEYLGELESARDYIVSQLQGWARSFLAWIGPMIPPMLAQLGDLAGKVFVWIVEQRAAFVQRLTQWGQAFVEWVTPLIPPLVAELLKIASKVLDWAKAQVPVFAKQLSLWAEEFIAWVVVAVPPLLDALGDLLSQVLDWLIAEGPELAATFINEWVPAALGWVTQTAIDILPKLLDLVLAIGAWILGTGVPKLIQFALSMGGAIITGVVRGLGNLAGALMDAIRRAIQSIDFWVGPFHITGSGISVSWPSLTPPSAGGSSAPVAANDNPNLYAYADGGLVPGPVGSPQLAVVHGGERVLTPQQQAQAGGGNTYTFTAQINNPVVRNDQDIREIVRQVEAMLARQWGDATGQETRFPVGLSA